VARFLARRLLLLVPTIWGITLVTFLLIHLAPGDPAAVDDPALSREAVAEFRATMGLDQPLTAQYGRWLGRVLRLDFGTSLRDGRPVTDKIAEALPRTLLLGGLALLLIVGVAVPVGIHGAVRQGAALEGVGKGVLFFLHAIPSFWLAVVLIELFCGASRYGVDWFPMQGLHALPEGASLLARAGDVAWHLVLPVFCLAYGSWAPLARQVRAALRSVLAEDFIRTARAKGLPEHTVIVRHALPHALAPAVAMLSVLVPSLLGGSVIVESIFGIPGLGQLGFEALTTRDYNTLMGVATFTAGVTLLASLIADGLLALLDPRVRHG
jgi:peptide/nickel transport system permease protein